MKRLGYGLLVSLVLGSCLLKPAMVSEAAISTQIIEERLAVRNAVIQKKLEIIGIKAGEKVKAQVAEKIKVKETAIAKKKAEVQAKKVAAEKIAAKKAAAEQVAANNQYEQNNENSSNQVAENQGNQTEAPVTNQDNSQVDVTSGASQTGREIGERNRQYGEQLSDPNLSQSERQDIITEKKNYNRSRR
ncbi:hypothetical protein [Vagococcus salmoninarum]|uniref:hypothetical protein n=1 Tax=Vagococcus salmoninarum TaxID=2739 RepID=UPI00187F3338|nr:hypothetical protein [Vagococcus salmoninarum]MBE9389614.1 hypothetical protein [Vagococcus salmoninarum]